MEIFKIFFQSFNSKQFSQDFLYKGRHKRRDWTGSKRTRWLVLDIRYPTRIFLKPIYVRYTLEVNTFSRNWVKHIPLPPSRVEFVQGETDKRHPVPFRYRTTHNAPFISPVTSGRRCSTRPTLRVYLIVSQRRSAARRGEKKWAKRSKWMLSRGVHGSGWQVRATPARI